LELKLVSEVCAELAMSNAGWINLDKGDFILKKLSSFDVYLFIKPYGSVKNMYYWLYIPYSSGIEITSSTLFKKVYKGKFGWWTESETINRHKIAHFMCCEERIMLYFAAWLDIYSASIDIKDVLYTEAKKMFAVQFMLYMDHKAHSIDSFQYTRYFYAELIKGKKTNRPNPLKVMESMAPGIRSRMGAFFIRSLIDTGLYMYDHPFEYDKEAANDDGEAGLKEYNILNSYDNMKGMRNLFTGGEITTGKQLICIFYLHYSSNENDKNENWSSFKILEKLLNEARKNRFVRTDYIARGVLPRKPNGHIDVTGYRSHEADMKYCCMLGKTTRKYLEKKTWRL